MSFIANIVLLSQRLLGYLVEACSRELIDEDDLLRDAVFQDRTAVGKGREMALMSEWFRFPSIASIARVEGIVKVRIGRQPGPIRAKVGEIFFIVAAASRK